MVALFKDRSPVTIFWLFVLSIIVHSHFFVHAPTVSATTADGLLSAFINQYIASLNAAFIILIYHAVILLQALRINHLFTDHRMYSRANYFPAMVYILLTGLFTEWSSLTPALLANFLVIWFFTKIVQLYNSPNPKTLLFNIGLLTGISTILYHPAAMLLPVAFFALMMLRPFNITEGVVLIMGVISPFYFLVSYLYLTDNLPSIKNYIPWWRFHLLKTTASPVFFITIAVIILVIFIALYFWQQENRRLLIQVRNNWVVLVVMLLVMLPVPFVNKDAGLESLLLCIVPASPLIAKGFLGPRKNTLPFIMFSALIVLGILKNWHIVKQ